MEWLAVAWSRSESDCALLNLFIDIDKLFLITELGDILGLILADDFARGRQ
jgi:hypothetical protein